MRLRCPGITSILGTNNPQRCRRYRGKPYHGISIPTIWFSGIYSFNERRIFKSLPACKSTLFRGVKSQKPNRRNKGIAKWSANIYRKSLAFGISSKCMLPFAVCHQIIPSLSLLIECDAEINGYLRNPMSTTSQLWRRTLVGLDAVIGKQLRAQTPSRS